MSLDPQVAALLEVRAALPAIDLETITPAALRVASNFAMPVADLPQMSVEDRLVPIDDVVIPVRLYRPNGAVRPPVCLFFHGGGWMVGDLDSHDSLCRLLAARSGCAILSVGYRLAPEHPFPAGLEDCYAITRWLHRQGVSLGLDTAKMAVAGDSAGGNLAAAVAIMARDRGGPPLRRQLLLYPNTDRDQDTASWRDLGEGYLLTRKRMDFYWRNYLGGRPDTPSLAAVRRTADLRGLPPAVVIVAEYDPLRDEGADYARALAAAGGKVVLHTAPGMIHGFLTMTGAIDAAMAWVDRVAAAMRP
ncbi:MAG: hypothetical protein JWO33_2290 [Caulobacteraceae bacterium]|nr:hypothetical protein [Caulobacteraceae bacterium]